MYHHKTKIPSPKPGIIPDRYVLAQIGRMSMLIPINRCTDTQWVCDGYKYNGSVARHSDYRFNRNKPVIDRKFMRFDRSHAEDVELKFRWWNWSMLRSLPIRTPTMPKLEDGEKWLYDIIPESEKLDERLKRLASIKHLTSFGNDCYDPDVFQAELRRIIGPGVLIVFLYKHHLFKDGTAASKWYNNLGNYQFIKWVIRWHEFNRVDNKEIGFARVGENTIMVIEL